MKSTKSALWLAFGIRNIRNVMWAGALVLLQLLSGSVAAESAPQEGAVRVVEVSTGGVYVEWTKNSGPPQVVGWHVERQVLGGGTLRVTDERVDNGIFDPPSFVYRFHDVSSTARLGDLVNYRLVAVDAELREWPFAYAAYVVEAAVEASLVATTTQPYPKSVPTPLATSSSTLGDRMRIVVMSDGLYRITASNIAAVLQGYDSAQAAQAIIQTHWVLSCGGESVAWRAEAGGGALQFFGQAYRDTYTDRNVYWLSPGSGLAMGFTNRTTTEVSADPWFWETAHLERNLYFMPYLPGGVEDDYWIWTGQQLVSPSTSWSWTTNVALTDLHPGVKTGMVTANLVSAYDGAPALDNHTHLYAASQLLDDRLWAGDTRQVQSGLATNLSGTSVSVMVELLRETNVTTTTVLIDSCDVRYARRMRAQNNQLLFQPETGPNPLTVRGFSTPAIHVFDVTDPLRPVVCAATIAQEGATEWRASWTANPIGSGRFLAVAGLSQPERMEGAADAGWGGLMAGAPHLVIAPRALTNAAAALVLHRRQQGLDSMLVPLEELYDTFAFGRRDPRAIPRFLAYAQTHWAVPPQYVCLAGDGHLDFHDYYGQSVTRPNHVPPVLDRIPYNAGTSGTRVTLGFDNPLADTNGDGIPELAIGRLPAQTASALTRMITRIVNYEASDTWKNKMLLMSDKDEDNLFELARERLAARVPSGLVLQRLGHTLATSPETMRAKFIQALNSGSLLAVYLGHANNVGMSSPYFFEHSYIRSYMSALTNLARAPLLLAGTCMLNDFASPHPDNRCLGKGFLDTAVGGAVAVWASSSEAALSMSEATTDILVAKLVENNTGRLGDLIRPALEYQAQHAAPWTVRASVLLGDPGTRIRTYQFSDHTPPAVQITGPAKTATYATLTNRLNLAGTASDLGEVVRVVIRNNRDGSEAVAVGTTRWQLNGVWQYEGTNQISVTAIDSEGNVATTFLQVIFLLALKLPEGQITDVRRVAGGLKLNWQGLAGHSYRIEQADSMYGPFHLLDPLVMATDENGNVTLPLNYVGRQMYFRINLVDENQSYAAGNGAGNIFHSSQSIGLYQEGHTR